MRVAVPVWEQDAEAKLVPYLASLRKAGLEPFLLDHPSPDLDGCDGLLLTGGVDIDPALYGEEPHPLAQPSLRHRDHLEVTLFNTAAERALPVLAICRGFQLVNVALGGSLLQHIEAGDHATNDDEGRSSRRHKVGLQSFLADLFGANRVEVNSRHHQAITPGRLAAPLEPLAHSHDGLVEAAFSPSHRWLLGVQWHPERPEPAIENFSSLGARLFAAFAEQVELAYHPLHPGMGRPQRVRRAGN